MKVLGLTVTLAAAGILSCGAPAWGQAAASSGAAQPTTPRQQKFYYHYEWTHGAVVTGAEWKRGAMIQHPEQRGLPTAATGEEWREIDRNYVLVSESTHAIVRVMAAPHPTIPGHSGGEP